MLLHEFRGKALLRSVGVPVPRSHLLTSAADVEREPLPYPVAVKAQVASGGRGKTGGVLRADDPKAAAAAAERILGMRFDGEAPRAVLVEPWLAAKRELYLSVTVDGRAGGYVVLYAPGGGVEVERGGPPVRYAVGTPDRFRAHELRGALTPIEGDASVRERVVTLARRLLYLAATRDCLTVEVNPMLVLEDGSLVAADAKVVLDESAAFRSSEIEEAVDEARRREPEHVQRCLAGQLMLVRLDGDVGLISGGAGMTMAAMDMIQEAGGRPACFLDCSANPTPTGYRLAFELLDADPNVRVILVSIFGGATHMERVARVMREIMAERRGGKPVVFRLDGTHAEAVEGIFHEVGLGNHGTLEEAVAAAIRLARDGHGHSA